MALSQRCVYSVRAVYELARRAGEGPVKGDEISRAQNIPPKFLVNILAQLRTAGIVSSRRGRQGGYLLARDPAELPIGEVIRLMDGDLRPVDCVAYEGTHGCPLEAGCPFVDLWADAHRSMMEVYDGSSFQSLLERASAQKNRKKTADVFARKPMVRRSQAR